MADGHDADAGQEQQQRAADAEDQLAVRSPRQTVRSEYRRAIAPSASAMGRRSPTGARAAGPAPRVCTCGRGCPLAGGGGGGGVPAGSADGPISRRMRPSAGRPAGRTRRRDTIRRRGWRPPRPAPVRAGAGDGFPRARSASVDRGGAARAAAPAGAIAGIGA